MTFSIDPPRRPSGVRRARRAEDARPDETTAPETTAPERANLPVPVSPARSVPRGDPRVGGDAAIHAQVLGEKRGLRAGPAIHDQAKASYNKTHWSGSSDRRAPKGRVTKTEI
jgi:hypothetical protein